MAKIDTSTIDGYEEMSLEDKVKFFEAFEYDDGKTEIEKYKKTITKANAEAADWKRKHNALLTDDEKKQQEITEKYQTMEKEFEALKREKLVSENKGKLIALGYKEELAQATADAMVDNDLATVFANQKLFLEEHDKTLKADVMKQTPTPPAGGSAGDKDYTKIISEAYARGDMATAAAYTRLQQEQAFNSK